ncbi:esterase/lipase [Hyaloraphidium curvatum]|nr:esterase/lipase [Hyaloraphidium curvatum]
MAAPADDAPALVGGVHPELTSAANIAWTFEWLLWPMTLWMQRRFMGAMESALAGSIARSEPAVELSEVEIAGPAGPLKVLVARPAGASGPLVPAMWIHGGGLVLGTTNQAAMRLISLAKTYGCLVASPDYRLAPEHKAPAAHDDCWATFRWLAEGAGGLCKPGRVALVGGESAGGGLATSVTLHAKDAGIPLGAQILVYPMLDDRTSLPGGKDPEGCRLVFNSHARFGWTAYLGEAAGKADGVDAYAVPARRTDFSGLPPTWIGVGTADFFCEESVAYARKLEAVDVHVELRVVSGAFHGFDGLAQEAAVSKEFTASLTGSTPFRRHRRRST